MALRQNIADIPLGNGLFSGDGVRVKRTRPPVQGKFRFGGDLRELLELIGENNSVAVDAAVGAGKSTRLPGEIAKKLGMLVIQVVPNEFLAKDLATYVASTGVECVAHLDPTQSWPQSGVVIVSASGLVAHWLHLGRADLPVCALFHDESHESDAYTYVIKTMWPAVAGVRKYISATATGSACDYRRQESGGHVEQKTYSANLLPIEWDLNGEDKMPWEIGSITDNTLIYVDEKEAAQRMLAAYNMAGFVAFRLHARMKMAQFEAAMSMARARDDIVVLIADSTFRSGFTMPVTTVVDTALVGSYTIEAGIATKYYRDAYTFERYQAAGRVGRVKGTRSVVWGPDVKPENKLVVLEDMDADAAVLLYRAFGKLPPVQLLDSEMCEGKVPRDLISALRGTNALTLLHENLLAFPEEMSTEGGRRSPMVRPEVRLGNADTLDYEDPIVSADVARTCRKNEMGKWEKRSSTDSGYGSAQDSSPFAGQLSVSDTIAGMLDAAIVDDVDIIEGGYYCVPSMPAGVRDFSSIFPDGYVSVVRVLTSDDARGIHYGLSASNRWVAVHSLVTRLNVVSCELNGALAVARDLGSLAKERDPVAVREWVSSFMSRVGEMQADSRVLTDCLTRVSHRFCEVQPVPHERMQAEEQSFSDYMVANLRALPLRNNAVGDVHTFVRKKMLEEMPARVERPPALRLSDVHSKANVGMMDNVKMPKVGRGMRSVNRRGSAESNAMRLGRWLVT